MHPDPTAFSYLPLETIGLTKSQAREIYGDQVKVYQKRLIPLKFALAKCQVKAAMNLVVAGEHERVVSCHIIGEVVDGILQRFAVATIWGTKTNRDNTLAIHSTNTEELITMRRSMGDVMVFPVVPIPIFSTMQTSRAAGR